MTIETLQLDKKMLEYSISQFRNIPEYVKICEAFSIGAETIQNSVNYLSNMIDKDKAEGVWLDYIGWLVGNIRQEYIDTSEFFCVNLTHKITCYKWTNNGKNVYTKEEEPSENDDVVRSDMQRVGIVTNYSNSSITVSFFDETVETYTANGTEELNTGDVNVLKRFYFPNISSDLGYTSNLSDGLFKKQIDAKIAYNVSNGTREDNIRIIKSLVNADKVIIENHSPMMLRIYLYGDNIITTNIKQRIENILAPNVGIYGDVNIFENLSYETIESEINTIVEMSGIEGDYEDYEYVDIDNDLDYILEIE